MDVGANRTEPFMLRRIAQNEVGMAKLLAEIVERVVRKYIVRHDHQSLGTQVGRRFVLGSHLLIDMQAIVVEQIHSSPLCPPEEGFRRWFVDEDPLVFQVRGNHSTEVPSRID